MNRVEIETYLQALGHELYSRGVTGKILLLGGAFMMFEVGNRNSTNDIDAYIASDYQLMYKAIAVVAQKANLSPDWLNDNVAIVVHQVRPPKSQRLWKQFVGLQVYIPSLEYVFALKLHAGRIKDDDDIKALAMKLNIQTSDQAYQVMIQYVPVDHVKRESLAVMRRCFKQ